MSSKRLVEGFLKAFNWPLKGPCWDPPWGPLETPGSPGSPFWGAPWEPLAAPWEPPGTSWDPPGSPLGAPGRPLRAPWDPMGLSLELHEIPWDPVVPPWEPRWKPGSPFWLFPGEGLQVLPLVEPHASFMQPGTQEALIRPLSTF